MSHLSATSPSLFLTLMFIPIVFFMAHVLLKTIDFNNCQLKHAHEENPFSRRRWWYVHVISCKRTTFLLHMCCPRAFFPHSSCEIATKSCKKKISLNIFMSRNIFILNTLLSALKGCSPSSQRCYLSSLSCALVQCHLTLDTAPVTLHLWKCELWPFEKWPLILTGPNSAWRTASDRTQMETQDAWKDRHMCAGGHRDTLIEWTGSGVQARGVTGEPRGRAQAGLHFQRKLLRHAGHVCFHVYWPSRPRSGDKRQQQTGLL